MAERSDCAPEAGVLPAGRHQLGSLSDPIPARVRYCARYGSTGPAQGWTSHQRQRIREAASLHSQGQRPGHSPGGGPEPRPLGSLAQVSCFPPWGRLPPLISPRFSSPDGLGLDQDQLEVTGVGWGGVGGRRGGCRDHGPGLGWPLTHDARRATQEGGRGARLASVLTPPEQMPAGLCLRTPMCAAATASKPGENCTGENVKKLRWRRTPPPPPRCRSVMVRSRSQAHGPLVTRSPSLCRAGSCRRLCWCRTTQKWLPRTELNTPGKHLICSLCGVSVPRLSVFSTPIRTNVCLRGWAASEWSSRRESDSHVHRHSTRTL